MECKICGKPVSSHGVGSPFYCTECNAQIALAAERLTRNSTRKHPMMAVADNIDF